MRVFNNVKFFETKEAMKILDISKPTLFKYLQSGKLKAIKHKGLWLFQQSDFDNYFKSLSK